MQHRFWGEIVAASSSKATGMLWSTLVSRVFYTRLLDAGFEFIVQPKFRAYKFLPAVKRLAAVKLLAITADEVKTYRHKNGFGALSRCPVHDEALYGCLRFL